MVLLSYINILKTWAWCRHEGSVSPMNVVSRVTCNLHSREEKEKKRKLWILYQNSSFYNSIKGKHHVRNTCTRGGKKVPCTREFKNTKFVNLKIVNAVNVNINKQERKLTNGKQKEDEWITWKIGGKNSWTKNENVKREDEGR